VGYSPAESATTALRLVSIREGGVLWGFHEGISISGIPDVLLTV
jgi:hypothetical protein